MSAKREPKGPTKTGNWQLEIFENALFVFRRGRVAFKDKERKLGRAAVSPHPNPLPMGEGAGMISALMHFGQEDANECS
jgi:hypothetical protein